MSGGKGERGPRESSRLHLTWVTNLPAPYRLPVWRRLAQSVDLRVVTLARTDTGRHWPWPTSEPYPLELCACPSLSRGETRLYLPTTSLHRRTAGAGPIMLGGWESPAYQSLLAAARRRGRPVVLFYESGPGSQRFHSGPIAAVRSRMMRAADLVVTVGQAPSRAVAEAGVPSDRIVETFNAVDVAWFADQVELARGGQPADRDFVYVGQLIQRKNVTGLLMALAAFDEGETLTIVGEGPLRGELSRLVQALDLGDRVEFVGHVNSTQLARQLARHHTLVLPSLKEVWGLVVNEALAGGLHVVVTTACGVAPAVAGMPGVILSETEPDALAAAMTQSRRTWTGPIQDPPILRHTPVAMADLIAARLGDLPYSGAKRAT